MKDELDKTIKDLQKPSSRKKVKASPDTALIPESGGQLVWKEANEQQPIENKDESLDYKREMYKDHFGVKDTYLPHVLVRLSLFPSNLEARTYIRQIGVVLNGKLTHDTDATNYSENFVIKFNDKEYKIFKVD